MSRPNRWLIPVLVATVGLAAACESSVGLVIDGRGAGASVEFPLRAGVYRVRFSAEDAGLTDHGCLFGLSIEQTVGDPNPQVDGIARRASGGKVVYRTLARGERIVGEEPSIALVDGSYRLRSEGGCAWQAEILPGDPRATVRPGGEQKDALEQG